MLSAHANIVVADDDRAARLAVETALRNAGYEVFLAADGHRALELVARHRAPLLVTDWEMPGLDGPSLCRRLRLDPPPHDLYILMLTIRSGENDALAALESGADDFLAKPVSQCELIGRVRNASRVLNMQRQLREARASAAAVQTALEARAAELAATRDVTVFALAKLAESRDPETGEHLERLRCYSQILAEELHRRGPYRREVDGQFLHDLYRSSPLHDIGKVGIPDAILRKPGRLTPEEFEIMKQHTLIGADALDQTVHHSGCGGFLAMAVDIARYHHERFDGSGYPYGLKGLEIPLPARIVALADVYDALTSVRVYKDAYDPEAARTMIEEQSGRHFDPAIVACFRAQFEEFQHVRETIERKSLAVATA